MRIANRACAGILLLLACIGARAQTPEQSSYYTAPYQRQALEIYRQSISMRTAAGHEQVPAFAGYLAQQFRHAGFPARDIHVLPFVQPDGEQSAGLVVRYRGDDSLGGKPILLTAHMDVVDALPQDWVRDPFTLTEENGFFFGRGSLDDKFGTTMLTATFLRLKAEGFVPGRDLIIAFTGDEETLMRTTRLLVTEHRELTDAEYAINADAGGGVLSDNGTAISYYVQASEKSYASFELTIRNPGGHSSAPRQDNAIYELARVLGNIEAHKFPVRYNDTTVDYFRQMSAVVPGHEGRAMARFAANPGDPGAAALLSKNPNMTGQLRTTCVATMLRGGHAENALPQSATATVNCRIFPGVSIEHVEAELLRVAANDALEIRALDDPKTSPASPPHQGLMDAISRTLHSRHPGIPVISYQAPYSTDAKEIRAAGIPTYGSNGLFINPKDVFAHGLNERVPVTSFYAGLEHWHTLLQALAGPPFP